MVENQRIRKPYAKACELARHVCQSAFSAAGAQVDVYPGNIVLDELGVTAAEEVRGELERLGIATRQGTHAAALQAYYREKYRTRERSFPNSVVAERLSLALPLYPGMRRADQDRVVAALERLGPGGRA